MSHRHQRATSFLPRLADLVGHDLARVLRVEGTAGPWLDLSRLRPDEVARITRLEVRVITQGSAGRRRWRVDFPDRLAALRALLMPPDAEGHG